MLFNKIKQNLAGFAAVAIAFTGLTAVAPASAVGTSVTFNDLGNVTVNLGSRAVSGNSLTLSATVPADTRMTSVMFNTTLADMSQNLAIQSGDQLKINAVYTNSTDNSTLSYFNNSWFDYSGTASSYNSGQASGGASGSGNTLTRTVALTSLPAGNYTSFYSNFNLSFTDPSLSAGDNIQVGVAYFLVRGGTETAINLPSQSSMSGTGFSAWKTASRTHTIAAGDVSVSADATFCIYRGENGVGYNTQIQLTYTNSGTAGAFDSTYAWASVYGSGTTVPVTQSGLTRSFTLPASGWEVVQVNSNAYKNSPLTAGQTVVPVLSAVINGSSTSVIDTCNRRVAGGAAPTVTPGSTNVTVSWGAAPSHPTGGTWDSIRVLACATTLANCGDYIGMVYGPSSSGFGYTYRNMTNLQTSATSFTVNSGSMMQMGPGGTWSASTDYKYYVAFVDMETPYAAVTSISAAVSASGAQQQVQNNVQNTPTVSVVPTNIPLVRPNLALSQTVRAGGALVIEADNAASVSEVKIGGVDAKLELVSKGVEVVVPTGLTPGAKDLFIKTATGSTLHVGAIKIADPIVEAAKLAYAKAASSIAFRAPIDQAVAGARPSASQVAEARAHAAEYKTAKEAVCVAVPASKATAASARAAATALCAAMKSVNRKLKVTIIVEAPSGDKTNVVTSELIG